MVRLLSCRILCRTFLALFLASVAFAQVQMPREFEVASVKLNMLNDRIVDIEVGPGPRFSARGYSLKLLIQRAFNMKGFQVFGGPSWLDVDRYDIVARAPTTVAGDLTEDQLQPMLQSLLIDRFRLRFHEASMEMPGFVLTANGWSKLKRSPLTEERSERTVRRRGAALVGEGITTQSIATILGAYLAKPVVDGTGLQGLYDFELTWSERADAVTLAPSDPVGVSLLTAVRDQLGLKLTAMRIPVATIVIESATQPSAN